MFRESEKSQQFVNKMKFPTSGKNLLPTGPQFPQFFQAMFFENTAPSAFTPIFSNMVTCQVIR